MVFWGGEASTLESDSPFWEAHVACAGEMDAGDTLVTRGSGIVHLQSWLMGSGLLASLGGVQTSKEQKVLLSKLKGAFLSACKKHRCWTVTRPPAGFQFGSCVLPISRLCLVFHKPPLPPKPSLSYSWRAARGGGTRNHGKFLLWAALPPCSILVKHKVILCCCSTQESAKCSTAARAQ